MANIINNYGSCFMRSQNNTNYGRLAWMLMEEGTHRIRVSVLNNLADGASLQQALAKHKPVFDNFKTKGVITEAQYLCLYPVLSPEPRYNDIDMNLWLLMARHLCTGRKHIKWNSKPRQGDTRWQHDALRLKEIRHELFHLPKCELEEEAFQTMWGKTVGCLSRLGANTDIIRQYEEAEPVDSRKTRECVLQIREQVFEELHARYMMKKFRKRHCMWVCGAMLLLGVLACLLGMFFPFPWRESGPCQHIDRNILSYVTSK